MADRLMLTRKSKELVISIFVFGVLLTALMAMTQHSAAQSGALLSVDLPVSQSLFLAHTNGTTAVSQDILKVGNLPVSRGLLYIQQDEIVSNTIYYRGYLNFDLSAISRVATITQASLVLNVDRFEYGYPGLPSPNAVVTCGIYPVIEDWASSTSLDWGQKPAILTFTTYMTPLVFSQPGAYTIPITNLVQDWVNGGTNYGLMVGMYPDPDAVADFTAVIHGLAAISETLRPHLHVTYQLREEPNYIYMPLVIRNDSNWPDLTVEIIQPIDAHNPSGLQIVVKNGGQSIAEDFWIDVYLDPRQTPTVNQPWPTLCDTYGAAWQVTSLSAGKQITLSIGGMFYDEIYSQWPMMAYPPGEHTIWAYVDSWSNQPWGWVNELDEDNNRAGPVMFSADAVMYQGTKPKPVSSFLSRPLTNLMSIARESADE